MTTVAPELRSAALTALAQHPTPAGDTLKVRAIAAVRKATNCGLREAVDAVRWAMLSEAQAQVDAARRPVPQGAQGWQYEFPNGYSASVNLDPHATFRFEVRSDAPTMPPSKVQARLTSEQVEALLMDIADLPTRD